MSEQYYRCENEYGDDACEFARNNHTITESQISSSIDGKNPKCPSKTLKGNTCGHELIAIGKKGSKKLLILKVMAGIIALLAIILSVVMWLGSAPIPDPKDPISSPDPEDPISSPDPEDPISSPDPISNPWNVYEELEASSNILREDAK